MYIDLAFGSMSVLCRFQHNTCARSPYQPLHLLPADPSTLEEIRGEMCAHLCTSYDGQGRSPGINNTWSAGVADNGACAIHSVLSACNFEPSFPLLPFR